MLTVFGAFTNFTVYNCFFTGIYNFRSSEVLDTRRVPFYAKFALSTLIAYTMCFKLWEDHIYEAELYQVALKYRTYYDKQYAEAVKKEQESADKNKSGSTL